MTMRSEGQFNSIIYEDEDTYRGSTNRWTVFMNAHDAAEMGVEEGGRVNLTTPQGAMSDVAVIFFDLPRGCAAAYYPEANVLASRQCDPRSHTPRFKSIVVSISPA